jgi:hypothetical protein
VLEWMRIITSSRNKNIKEKKLKFYEKYASLIFCRLKKPRFQKFLNWILTKENIQKSKIKNVQIRMFPFVKESGNQLIGKCNSKGEIFLYPKKLDNCRKKMDKLGNTGFKQHIVARAKAGLIHELLHLKYEDNETKVRELTSKYYSTYSNHNP